MKRSSEGGRRRVERENRRRRESLVSLILKAPGLPAAPGSQTRAAPSCQCTPSGCGIKVLTAAISASAHLLLFSMCQYCTCECFRVFLGLLLGVSSKCFWAAAVSALAMSQWLVLATVEMPPNGAYACIPTNNTLPNSLHIVWVRVLT